MKDKVSNRDIELLSAYLDNELGSKERNLVDERLTSNPDLRRILGELHQNRAALRSLPRLRAPRNFTLSPEAAGVKPEKRTYPVFGLVSALSSLVLILVLVGDFIFQPALISQPAADQPSAEALIVETTSGEEILREAEIVKTPQAEAPEELLQAAAAESEAGDESPVMEAEGVAGTPAVETPRSIDTFSSKIPQTATQTIQGETATPSPTQTVVQPTQTPTIALPTTTIESEAIQPIESILPSTPITIEPQPTAPGLTIIRILEILLAAVALGTGGLALYLRSRNL